MLSVNVESSFQKLQFPRGIVKQPLLGDRGNRGIRFLASLFFFVGLVLGFSTQASAYQLSFGSEAKLDLKVEEQVRYLRINDFPLDELNTRPKAAEGGVLFHRFRFNPEFRFGQSLKAVARLDFAVLDNLYGFDTEFGKRFYSSIAEQSGRTRWVDFRELWGSWMTRVGLFKFGQTSAHFGLGLIANSGDKETGEFSMPRYGDIVERLMWYIPILRPFTSDAISRKVILAAGADLVFRDENANLLEGDFAIQGVFSLFYRDITAPGKDESFFGVNVAIRNQTERDGRKLSAQNFGLAFRFYIGLTQNLILELAGEGAWLLGETTRARTEGAPEGVEINAYGGVGRAFIKFANIGIRVGAELGFASGDNDVDDRVSRRFRFDPDYQPSLILFQRLLGAISAHNGDRAADPDRVGYPPPGSDQIPSMGSVAGAYYYQFVLAVAPFTTMKMLKRLELKAGLLIAGASSDFMDAYNSFRSGGTSHTHLKVPSAERRDLGMELNLSLRYGLKIWKSLDLSLAVLYGHFFPGSIFQDKDGKSEAIDSFQAQMLVRF